jgi:hypothetical protein
MLEIGVYRGKSAILMGCGLRHGERLIACDMFEKVMSHEDITAKHRTVYADLDAAEFCRYWGRYHGRQQLDLRICDSAELTGLPPLRFTHIDGCHNHQCVRRDITLAARHAGPRGVISLDDYRVGEPGVTAAIREAIAAGELFPVCASDMKLYAATNLEDQARWAAALATLPGAASLSFANYDVATLAVQVSQPLVAASLLTCMPADQVSGAGPPSP